MSTTLTRLNTCIAIATTILVLLGLGLSSASARTDRLANQLENANELRILESGAITSLTATPAELAADREAIDAVFQSDRARNLIIDASMLRPYDQVMTVLVGTDTGFPLTMEIDLSNFRIGNEEVELAYYPFTLENILVRSGVNELNQISLDEVADYMTASEAETHYFCQREDGNGGSIIKATMMVSINDYLVSVPVELRRDANQQENLEVLSSKKGGSDWGISWFSSDCKKVKGKCPRKKCKVTLKSVIAAAAQFNIDIPDDLTTLEEILNFLLGEGLSVGGDCRKTKFLGLISVGCQCWLFTLFSTGSATPVDATSIDTTTANSLDTAPSKISR